MECSLTQHFHAEFGELQLSSIPELACGIFFLENYEVTSIYSGSSERVVSRGNISFDTRWPNFIKRIGRRDHLASNLGAAAEDE